MLVLLRLTQQALQQALQMQQMVYQQYGPMNGLVSLTNIRNTLADSLALSGVRNADRYFAPITPEIEMQMLQMQQQQQAQMAQQGQAQDPNAAFLQAEQMKAQTKAQTDMMKLQLEAQKAAADDDLKRDQMQKLWSRFGKYVILAISVVVVSVGGLQGYTTWQDRQAKTAATAFHNALAADDLKAALMAELDQLSPGYVMLAKFRIAAAQSLAGDYAAAEAGYLALSTDPAVKQLYQQAAILLSVMNAPMNRSADELATRLAVLEGQAGPWQAMALEQAAGLALRAGDRKTAVAKYTTLAGLSDIPPGVRQRASQMLKILNG